MGVRAGVRVRARARVRVGVRVSTLPRSASDLAARNLRDSSPSLVRVRVWVSSPSLCARCSSS